MCDICLEEAEKCQIISCYSCNLAFCTKCLLRNILQYNSINCMKCNTEFNRSYLYKLFGKQFINKDYKRIREEKVYDLEKIHFPAAISIVEILKRLETELFPFYNEHKYKISMMENKIEFMIKSRNFDLTHIETPEKIYNKAEIKKINAASRTRSLEDTMLYQWYEFLTLFEHMVGFLDYTKENVESVRENKLKKDNFHRAFNAAYFEEKYKLEEFLDDGANIIFNEYNIEQMKNIYVEISKIFAPELVRAFRDLFDLRYELDRKINEFIPLYDRIKDRVPRNIENNYNFIRFEQFTLYDNIHHYYCNKYSVHLGDRRVNCIVVVAEAIEDKAIENNTKINKKCFNEKCSGFLTANFECLICKNAYCKLCHDIKKAAEKDGTVPSNATGTSNATGAKDENVHICNPANAASVALIKQETKECPKCHTNIYRIDGCNQMWCTICQTAFSYLTGKIEKGAVHNPHYFDWLKKNKTGAAPAQNNCDNEVIDNRLVPPGYMKLFTLYADFINAAPVMNSVVTWEKRIQFISGEITEKQFIDTAQKRDKKYEKEKEFYDIVSMFKRAANDIMEKISTLFTQKVIQIVNREGGIRNFKSTGYDVGEIDMNDYIAMSHRLRGRLYMEVYDENAEEFAALNNEFNELIKYYNKTITETAEIFSSRAYFLIVNYERVSKSDHLKVVDYFASYNKLNYEELKGEIMKLLVSADERFGWFETSSRKIKSKNCKNIKYNFTMPNVYNEFAMVEIFKAIDDVKLYGSRDISYRSKYSGQNAHILDKMNRNLIHNIENKIITNLYVDNDENVYLELDHATYSRDNIIIDIRHDGIYECVINKLYFKYDFSEIGYKAIIRNFVQVNKTDDEKTKIIDKLDGMFRENHISPNTEFSHLFKVIFVM